MIERPILFSAPMVLAILDGAKTQTRRVMKPQPEHSQFHSWKGKYIYDGEHSMWCWKDILLENIWDFPNNEDRIELAKHSPYGVPGDRLWVRETWASAYMDGAWGTAFRADGSFSLGKKRHEKGPHFHAKELGPHVRWKPSIFLPRCASRIVLEITDVRVQRLQEISEEDAIAEGVESPETERYDHNFSICPQCAGTRLYTSFRNMGACFDTDCLLCDTNAKRFQHLWNSINEKKYPWSSNSFIWAISFKRI